MRYFYVSLNFNNLPCHNVIVFQERKKDEPEIVEQSVPDVVHTENEWGNISKIFQWRNIMGLEFYFSFMIQ